jgi:hypothetical protein
MINSGTDAAPRTKARLAGLFELFEGLTSAAGQVFILGKLVVIGSAADTAANILAHEPLVWLGFALSVVGVVFHLVWVLLFYELFKPVNRSVSRLALLVMLVGCSVQALTCLLYVAPLLTLNGGIPLSALTAEQLQALAYVFVRLNAYAFNLYLVLFGVWCVLSGYLIFRCNFLPRIFGVLLMIDGLGWMTYLYPALGFSLFHFIAIASGLAELALPLWLLVFGVNAQRWKQQAAAGRA